MTKTTSSYLAALALLLVGAATASAQTARAPKLFISVNGGGHAGSTDFTIDATQPVYGETAVVRSEQSAGGGPMFDLSAGYRVWENVSIALGFSRFSDSSSAKVTGTVPHPLFFDRAVTSTAEAADLTHSQRAVHLSFMWTTPVADKMDASVFAGPSFIKVTQEFVKSIQIAAGTQSFTPVVTEESKNVTGFHIGGDVTYTITPMIGVGGLARFVIGSAELESISDLSLSGFEVGGGLRLRF